MRSATHLILLAAVALLAGCERPPVDSVQSGYRGTGMEQVYNPRILVAQADQNKAPESPAPASPDGPKAGQVYQNVKVLGDLSVGEFARNMVAITNWVAPNQGCAYCHNPQNFADDSLHTKVVARRMLQMTQNINGNWKNHVADTGVTCYTCHRGQPIPANTWFKTAGADAPVAGMLGDRAGQNAPAIEAAFSSLPGDPFKPFLAADAAEIRVIGTTALPTYNRQSTKQAEWTYSLMMHMSQSLGVNCTFCHNTRSFAAWDASTPQRGAAWYGIRMTREINEDYLKSLAGVFPADRLGPQGDVAKANCATCHQGAYKPLYGASMLKDHPELAGVRGAAAAPAATTVNATAAMTTTASGVTVLFFAVNSATLPDDAISRLANLVAALKARPEVKAAISGFHSAAGNLEQNQELAKSRAKAVRDALTAAGIGADRVELDKPMSAEANLSGEDPQARRVEVTMK
ncbi:photosynthetic reaction center cytochrome PufC [Rivibacter subsaxonicus]|uniref:Photosynthetic reaction center cytochrome c subunit n=1 Tax=Rivibacter subsaxonicus TaxID=457575 RepID=A0A4Q7W0V9_9BURK|nr:photosynthetic reaction center cytochrome PufC [Rivibacter subsaxonicus]RZU02862.1 photosynthetic reaction center cytochrome c subunit [Rivibacter subsaxonicus]